ncbi:MAG: phosphoserine phosphatase SerB [Actinomycetota bacterium]|nr:phosphoserine phosphatase SerB [Actinomycetota bacterium]
MDKPRTLLVRVSGRDQPGITAALLSLLTAAGAQVHDIEQVTTRERLTLDLLVGLPDGDAALKDLLFLGWERGLSVDFEVVEPSVPSPRPRHAVTVIGLPLTTAALAAVAREIATAGANIDRITRMSRYPVVSYELVVSGGDVDALRAGLVAVSAQQGIDVAVQREGLERRAKRLVVMDVDSTLIQDEAIDLLASEAGQQDAVRAITERAMAGEVDFETALRARVALLAGLDLATLQRVRDRLRLTPGARTFVRTLKRLGYRLAMISGGFTFFTDMLGAELGIDHAFANQLEIVDGRVTGRIVGRVIDRARKAEILSAAAASEGVPLEQVVAIGDGANDLDMLARAGLGIAFNAKPIVREAADTAVSVPYLDAVLFVLGIHHDDIDLEDVDHAPGELTSPPAGSRHRDGQPGGQHSGPVAGRSV